MSVGPKYGVLGIITVRCVLTSGGRVNVSRFGTHRSNEWEGMYDSVFAIHAARDQPKDVK